MLRLFFIAAKFESESLYGLAGFQIYQEGEEDGLETSRSRTTLKGISSCGAANCLSESGASDPKRSTV